MFGCACVFFMNICRKIEHVAPFVYFLLKPCHLFFMNTCSSSCSTQRKKCQKKKKNTCLAILLTFHLFLLFIYLFIHLFSRRVSDISKNKNTPWIFRSRSYVIQEQCSTWTANKTHSHWYKRQKKKQRTVIKYFF